MCLHTNQAGTALKLLRLAKSFDNQFWWFQSPLRHFEGELGLNIIKGVESRQDGGKRSYDSFGFALSLLDMTAEEVGQMCRAKKAIGQKVKNHIKMIPRPILTCRVLPVTREFSAYACWTVILFTTTLTLCMCMAHFFLCVTI